MGLLRILWSGLLLVFLSGQSDSKWELIQEIDGKTSCMATDPLGNLYMVHEGNLIRKYDSTGQLRYQDNAKIRGDVYSIDASNPLEIQVFYQTNGKVVYLDNTLGYRGETDLIRKGYVMVSTCSRSFDNGLWIFDPSDILLKRLNKSGELIQKSANAQTLNIEEQYPFQMVDIQDRVLVSQPGSGIYIFDIQANFLNTLPIPGITYFQANSQNITWSDSVNFYSYFWLTRVQTQIKLPPVKNLIQVKREKDIFYLRTTDKVYIYRFNR